MKKNAVKGGNTNLYKTRIKPRKLKRYSTRKSKNDRGGGLFKFLSNGLKHIAKKALSSLSKLTKKALSEGASIAKKQLQKKSVQKDLKNAVSEASQMAVTHALRKVNPSSSPSSSSEIQSPSSRLPPRKQFKCCQRNRKRYLINES